jgi:N4-(beta-N-acetylglucosaminyl)-L-asparaginase
MFVSASNSVFFLVFGLWRSISASANGFTFKVNEQKIVTVDNEKKIELNFPIVVNTWAFTNATERAWATLAETDDALQAVQDGCGECEEQRCDGTVGWGGSPDETGETALDALIMDGPTHSAGSVASMKRVKSAIAVARAVMNYTKHTLLVGEAATRFAVEMGFQEEDIHSVESMESWIQWHTNRCQPNFRINVSPDPDRSCGPYEPLPNVKHTGARYNEHVSQKSHDTIGMIAVNSRGDIATGTSTNGAGHKVPGY